MNLGYPSFYSNGINSNTQLRNPVDMIYQRGGTYEVVLTGDTYITSMELDVNLYADDNLVGKMTIVPYQVTQSNSIYSYRFNVRPYFYYQSYLQSQHFTNYIKNDWVSSNQLINLNNPYPNSIKGNFKFNYRFTSGTTIQYEYTGGTTTTNSNLVYQNDYNHYNYIPYCKTTGFTGNDFTNTGKYFTYLGGAFQFDNRFILQNFDQELGTVVGQQFNFDNSIPNKDYSPISQYLLDYPSVPEMSNTGRFLTNAPRVQYIQQNENYTLSYLNGQSGHRFVTEADYAVFEFYDGNNNLIDYYEQELNMSGTTYQSPTGFTTNMKIFHLPCGPVDITNMFKNVVWDNIFYYRVQLFYSYPTNLGTRRTTGAVGPVSEAFYFYLYNNCLPENTRITWLNPLGGYDYYTFQSYRQQTNKIERQTYDSRYYSTNLNTPDRDISRTLKTFDTKVNQELTIQSTYLSLTLSQWIEELFYSPQVYELQPDFISPIDNPNKYYKDLNPLQITSTQVDVMTKKHSKLNKYQITFTTANNYFVNKGF